MGLDKMLPLPSDPNVRALHDIAKAIDRQTIMSLSHYHLNAAQILAYEGSIEDRNNHLAEAARLTLIVREGLGISQEAE